MASKQIALTRVRPALQAAPQTTRIPAFLNKLHEMVNDPKTNHLIEWAPDGDSFYVYNQEQFARDVLPHWFKHQNFASFVRQLNMYGFHKVPHLQQGVLKGDADTEYWNFEHANFRRDQPDLLCLIQRKKSANVPDEEKIENPGNNATMPTTGSGGQMLDLQSIVNGISTIKRHQTAISAELSDLRRSNELLWKESEAARARHQKQQDTINRIVKFLAGVFGNHVNVQDDVSAPSPSRAVVPRRQSRLMIEGGTMDPLKESPVPYTTMETPMAESSPTESDSPKAMTVNFDSPITTPITLSPEVAKTDLISTLPAEDYSLSRSRSPNPDLDHIIQTTLSTMTPAQIQQLMHSMSMPPSYTDLPAANFDQDSSLMSYQPALDFGQLAPLSPLLDPLQPQYNSLSEKVDKSWKATQDIEQDVDAVDNRISNLFQQFELPGDTINGTDQNAESELFRTFMNGLDDPIAETTVDEAEIGARKRKSISGITDSSVVELSPEARNKRRREK
ncbi:Transcriptional factor [Mycena indigotica]|uniref:Transcriptional factor n=1 Tax=Mycena indigotica TaxID=2126181 RepID=A0A8H6VV84_9AGAR|nr:Transcriptional factor [Mycena indigotica]KAF7295127.1 Transcriptional factor [Mycena indigotica]